MNLTTPSATAKAPGERVWLTDTKKGWPNGMGATTVLKNIIENQR
jgi:hypothetical protein